MTFQEWVEINGGVGSEKKNANFKLKAYILAIYYYERSDSHANIDLDYLDKIINTSSMSYLEEELYTSFVFDNHCRSSLTDESGHVLPSKLDEFKKLAVMTLQQWVIDNFPVELVQNPPHEKCGTFPCSCDKNEEVEEEE